MSVYRPRWSVEFRLGRLDSWEKTNEMLVAEGEEDLLLPQGLNRQRRRDYLRKYQKRNDGEFRGWDGRRRRFES